MPTGELWHGSRTGFSLEGGEWSDGQFGTLLGGWMWTVITSNITYHGRPHAGVNRGAVSRRVSARVWEEALVRILQSTWNCSGSRCFRAASTDSKKTGSCSHFWWGHVAGTQIKWSIKVYTHMRYFISDRPHISHKVRISRSSGERGMAFIRISGQAQDRKRTVRFAVGRWR